MRSLPFSRARPFYNKHANCGDLLEQESGLAAESVAFNFLGYMQVCQNLCKGSVDPIFEVAAPNNHSRYGFWGKKPQILGTWTRWVTDLRCLGQGTYLDLQKSPMIVAQYPKTQRIGSIRSIILAILEVQLSNWAVWCWVLMASHAGSALWPLMSPTGP